MEMPTKRFNELIREAMKKASGLEGTDSQEFSQDLSAVTTMLKEGYSVTDVVSVLRKNYMVRKEIQDLRAANLYADKILDHVNESIAKERKNSFQEATNALSTYIAADKSRYKDYDEPQTFGMYRKGAIILNMMVKDGFEPEICEAVLSKTKLLQFDNDEEIKALVKRCKDVSNQYSDIRAARLETEAKDAKDIYLQYAKEYMLDTGVQIFGRKDEEKIVATMRKQLKQMAQDKIPKTQEDQRAIDEVLEQNLQHFLQKALENGSPTANEAGRDKQQYIQAVLYGAQNIQSLIESPKETYDRTQQLYLGFIDEYKEQREAEKKYHPAVVFDGEMTKKLIDEMQDERMILKNLEENSPFVRTEFNPKETPEEYAQWVLAAAKESYHREKEILYAERKSIERGKNYMQLLGMGITPTDLYREALLERIDAYPTFRTQLSEPQADVDACVKLIHAYSDIDRNALKTCISEYSPRKVLAGIPENYEDYVVEKAQTELEKIRQQDEKLKRIERTFNQAHGFAAEGVHDEKPMNLYKDGKVAVQMMQKNFPIEDIKQMIIKIAPKNGVVTPQLYASNILAGATLVIDRTKAIEAYQQGSRLRQVEPKDFYFMEAKKLLNPKGFPDTNMDVEIYKKMLLKQIPQEEIDQIIDKYSPNAAEPGRDSSYTDFIKTSAEQQLEEEKKKLEEYQVFPRSDHEENPEEEYEYQRKKLSGYIRLPFEPRMDEKIATGLLQQGFEPVRIIETIKQKSKAKEAAEPSYGEEIMKRARKILQELLKHSQQNPLQNANDYTLEKQRVRSRMNSIKPPTGTDGEPGAV